MPADCCEPTPIYICVDCKEQDGAGYQFTEPARGQTCPDCGSTDIREVTA